MKSPTEHTLLTLVLAEWTGTRSCLAAARERPASRPARRVWPPRSLSPPGGLDRDNTVSRLVILHTHM